MDQGLARRNSPFCFPADTPVHTERGLVPIGEVVAGDKVWGYDFAAGRWTLAEVSARHDRDYRGDLYTLVAETGETVRTTTGHPFWVTAGDDLFARPACEQLEPREDEGRALPGRWVNSHDLKPGDHVVLRAAAEPVRLADVTHEPAKLPVCNLTVPTRPNYAVAAGGFLVHNAGSGYNKTPNNVPIPSSTPKLSSNAKDLLNGQDVRVKTIREADALLREALPNARKVTGTGPGQSSAPDWKKFKGTDPNGKYHKDYHFNPDTGRIFGHGPENRHALFKHINIKLPDGDKVTIIIEPN
ncbi:MAG: Hint domain-containing protein [Planctomycetia bacterium]